MSTSWPLVVEVDCPEPRMDLGRLAVAAEGQSWDIAASSDIWVDPVTNTAMLAPLPTTAEWATTFTGDYARLRKADYTLTTSADWVETIAGASGDYFLQNKGTNELVRTTATYPINQPWFFSVSVPGMKGMNKRVILDAYLGYGVAGEVILRFRSDGSVELWQDGVMQDTSQRSASNLARGNNTPYFFSMGAQHCSIMIIPCRRREILIVTNYGLACSFTDIALPEDGATNTITPAGPMAWNVPSGRACVQAAPVRFKESGTLYGQVKQLRYAPPVGATFTDLAAYDTAGPYTATTGHTYSVVKHDGSAFTPDGVTRLVRAKAALTGDGDGTKTLYAFDLYYTPDPATTADEPVDITTAVTSLAIAVGEDGKARLSMEAKRGKLIALGMEQPTITTDRPIRVSVGGVDIFRGALSSPQIRYEETDESLNYSTLSFEGQDRSQDFDLMTFTESVPYDGLTLTAAVTDQLVLCGYTSSDLYMDSTPVTIPFSPDISKGKWTAAPEMGGTVGKLLEQLQKEFASTWITGWVPTLTGYTYQWRDPLQLSDTPAMALWQSRADAVAGGVTAAIPSRVVREMSSHYEPPEANSVMVVGQDNLGNLLWAYDVDAPAQTPGTLPADRPRNWRGRAVQTVLTDPALKNQETVDLARDVMSQRLMPAGAVEEDIGPPDTRL
ncbi:MAG: hypothetical protein IPK85_04095 [Gemmatimonadetes bacterium]|nr:hypothetical protein [Gemmatimonadota bacterium]